MGKAIYNSPLGKILLETEDGLLSLCSIEGQSLFHEIDETKEDETINLVKSWLKDYFDLKNPDPYIIPRIVKGTSFQMDIWNILLDIPYGETKTYGEIAKIYSKTHLKTMSSQAVGGAIKRNPISIIIPCHRVIGKDNKLVGYNGGLDKKSFLLELEKSHKQ